MCLMVGCGSAYRPKAPIPASTFSVPFLADLSSPTLFSAYDAMPDGPAKVARRNAIIYEYEWLIDNVYGNYENSFFTGQAYMGTAADAAVLGLSAAGAVTGTAQLKAILAAVAGGVTGLRASYEHNFFDAATREVIVETMHAARDTVRARIAAGEATCLTATVCPSTGTAYTLEDGFADLQAYFSAGTVMGALLTISGSATNQAAAARQSMRALRGLPPEPR
jgi:hypothetical protein